MAILSQEDGRHPPFGATVHNAKDRELGMVSDSGLAWLTGVNPDERLTVHWSGSAQCEVVLPRVIPAQQLFKFSGLYFCTSTQSGQRRGL